MKEKNIRLKKKEWIEIQLGGIYLRLNNDNMRNMRVAFEILTKDIFLNNYNDMRAVCQVLKSLA